VRRKGEIPRALFLPLGSMLFLILRCPPKAGLEG
jgi:hypothetical protein